MAAAKASLGYNLIIASAGTGKTSTIVGRIAHLLKGGIAPEEILLLTFTNKASQEMIERISRYFGEKKAQSIEAGTFHSVSYRYLKKIGRDVVLKDSRELKTLFRSTYEKRDFGRLFGQDKPYSPNYLYELYSLYQNSTTGEFGEWLKAKAPEQERFLDVYLDMFDEFKTLKKSFHYVDYDDLLLEMKSALKEVKAPYREVLVDEYQDTNPLQGSLIDEMKAGSLFCVGDYDQSIYAFNGADINIIASFKERYSGASVFTLTKNYRSSREILSLANRVIEHNERIYPKSLEVVRNTNAEPPKLLIYEELFEQYQGIANKIKLSTRAHTDIAVLFRNNSSADGIEASLRELGIKTKRRGGISFFDTKEVKAMLDLCTLFANGRDMMAFIHLFEYGRNIGSSLAKELYDALSLLGGGDIFKGVLYPKDINPFTKKVKSPQLGLFDDTPEFKSVIRFKDLHLPENLLANPILKHPRITHENIKFVWDFYELLHHTKPKKEPKKLIIELYKSPFFTHIVEFLAHQRSLQKDGTVNEAHKREALEKIERKIVLLSELASHYSEMGRFLNAMILGSKEMSEGEGVNLLSVHASKGLEFGEVYIIDLMDGRFPNRKLVSRGGSIEEERRLFYVAVTRAKDSLYLSFAKSDRVKKIDYLPSQFLFEAGLLQK